VAWASLRPTDAAARATGWPLEGRHADVAPSGAGNDFGNFLFTIIYDAADNRRDKVVTGLPHVRKMRQIKKWPSGWTAIVRAMG
jgi:hypothetical protein